jgi:Na+-translocating ferredoxin:NAD+ oxidoreductase RnfG subunit
MKNRRLFIPILLILALLTPATAQIEGVQNLKSVLKEVLQKKGARSLKKNILKLSAADIKDIQTQYGFKPNSSYTVYTGLDADKKPMGSAVLVDIQGKEGPLQLVVALNNETGQVYNLAFTVFGEERGKPAAKKTFMKQFIGFTKKNVFKLGKDVDGVSGATWTSTSVTQAVQHAVGIFDYFVFNPRKEDTL